MVAGLEESPGLCFLTPGVMSPDQVYQSMMDAGKLSWAAFDFHPHNDYGLGVANAMYAVKAESAASIARELSCRERKCITG